MVDTVRLTGDLAADTPCHHCGHDYGEHVVVMLDTSDVVVCTECEAEGRGTAAAHEFGDPTQPCGRRDCWHERDLHARPTAEHGASCNVIVDLVEDHVALGGLLVCACDNFLEQAECCVESCSAPASVFHGPVRAAYCYRHAPVPDLTDGAG